MIRKAKIAIAVLEVPDLQTKRESEMLRRDALSQEEYDKKYTGLEHTYYQRGWFSERARKHGFRFELLDQNITNYAQSKFRFNCLIFK
ncbi:MAG: hypothetical protein IPL59_26010 [Candidatus Competibacteraceae bacterium]|nr:hypothetical protein [Candidatus Competibacteraceae bacterium]